MKPTFWDKLIGSLDNVTRWAFSARKLTAITIMSCIVLGHFVYYKHCSDKEDFSIYHFVLIIDYIALGFFLGLITFQQIINFKNGAKEELKSEHNQNENPVNQQASN